MADGSGGVLLSPTFPPGSVNPSLMIGAGGNFDRMRKSMVRKTVDYHCSVLRYLENRIWQRDCRDKPVIQPDTSYFNEVVVPFGLQDSPVNAVTTKFVKACANKARSPIFCTAWVPDGRRLVTGAASGEFTLWNGVNFNFESIIQAHDCSVRSITWSNSGKWMVTTDDRGFVKYWQINFNNVHTFQGHSEPVRSSSFSPTDSKLATCSDDGTVRVFDFLSCTEEHLLRGHGADVKCLQWHPSMSLLVSGSKDNQQPVKLWDPKAGQSVCTIHAHKATVMDVKWNRNGNWFATASRDHLIKVYDIRKMKELLVLKGHKKDVNTLSWHPVHEGLFASGGSDGAVLFWTMGNGREIGGMESAHEGFVWSLSWHPLGHLLCSGANDHTCKFWCRNRPGEEIKDKYNTFHNPFFGSENESYSMPGMGVNEVGVSLPPPSHMNNPINLPPPSLNTWMLESDIMSTDEHLPSPQLNVPVLGADIIAQTFAEKRLVDDYHNNTSGNNPVESPTVKDQHEHHGQPSQGGGEYNDISSRGQFDNHSNIVHGQPGHRGGRPPDDHGYNPFSWHNPRHANYDDEQQQHRWPMQQGGNRFIYRHDDGPTDNNNRRMMMDEQRKDDWRPHPSHLPITRRNNEEFGFISGGQEPEGHPWPHPHEQRDGPVPKDRSPYDHRSFQAPPTGNQRFMPHDQLSPRDQGGSPRGPHPPPHDHGGPGPHPSHDPRGPRDQHGPPSDDTQVPHDPRGVQPHSHDPRGLTSSRHDTLPPRNIRGPPRGLLDHQAPPPLSPHDNDPRGPSHNDRRPSHGTRAPPPDSRVPPSHSGTIPYPRGQSQPPIKDPRGALPPHDRRLDIRSSEFHEHMNGPRPSFDPHGPPMHREPPHFNQSGPPRGAPYSQRGPAPDSRDFRNHSHLEHDHHIQPPERRGPPPRPHDQRGPLLGPHDQRGPPPGPHNQRGPPPGPHNQRGPPTAPHDQRGPPPGPHEQRGPPPRPHNFQGDAPSDPRMIGDFKGHRPNPQHQPYHEVPPTDGFGHYNDPRFERRDNWSHRGGREDDRKNDVMLYHHDDRRGRGRGRDGPGVRRGSADEREINPPAKRPRN